MSDLVARLREYTCGYCNDRPFLVTDEAADEIERLKSELAAANAKIKAVREIHHAHSVLTAECVSCRGIFPCRTIRALESATPQGSLAGSPIQAKDDQC